MRAINAVTELNRAGETLTPITTIAIHDEADTRAWFVREADEHVCLERGTRNPRRRRHDASAYLDAELLMASLHAARADSLWVGWGSQIEYDRLAKACELAGIVFIGPPSETVRFLEDRAAAGRLAKGLGIPVARTNRLDEGRRRVEVQVVADAYGNIWPVGVRDCSIRLGGRKLLTESSCAAPGPVVDEELREAAVKLCRAANYSGVGSVEFLLEPDSGWFEFVQFTTGLQLEHPVTEVTTGLDLVKLQLQLALGLSLHGGPPASWGHAVGAVVCAEDPEQGFAAAAGRIALFRPPAGAGIRVDTGVAEGDVTPGGYSSPIAKIIAWGRDREEALDRLERALAQCAVIVEGGTTNRSFLLSLLGQPELRSSEFDNHWLERLVEMTGMCRHRPGRPALRRRGGLRRRAGGRAGVVLRHRRPRPARDPPLDRPSGGAALPGCRLPVHGLSPRPGRLPHRDRAGQCRRAGRSVRAVRVPPDVRRAHLPRAVGRERAGTARRGRRRHSLGDPRWRGRGPCGRARPSSSTCSSNGATR